MMKPELENLAVALAGLCPEMSGMDVLKVCEALTSKLQYLDYSVNVEEFTALVMHEVSK